MTAWGKDELHRIAETDDLHIGPFREDGVTPGKISNTVTLQTPHFRTYKQATQDMRETVPIALAGKAG